MHTIPCHSRKPTHSAITGTAKMAASMVVLMRRAVVAATRSATATHTLGMQRSNTLAAPMTRLFSRSSTRQHSRNDGDNDFVKIGGAKPAVDAHDHDHDHDSDDDDDEDDDEVDVVDIGPAGVEYGGPQRGGKFKEPTRFGDWERKGRCTDF